MSISRLPEFASDGYQVEPSTTKINEIIDAVNSGGGGGGGATFPMAEGAWYTPFTAIGGQRDTNGHVAFEATSTAYAAPIRLYEPCGISAVGVRTAVPSSGTPTMRFALFSPSASGMVGEKVADLGTVSVPSSGDNGDYKQTSSTTPELPAGWYFIVVSVNSDTAGTEMIKAGDGSPGFGGPIATFAPTDDPTDGPAIGIEITATGIGNAIPSDLTSATQEPSEFCPMVFFQITHD